MNCCNNDSTDPGVDKLLSGARLLLVAGQGASSIVPIPGIGPVTTALITLIDKIAVRTPSVVVCAETPDVG